MRFFDLLSMSFRSLGANKLRSALTMSGVTIGVFSVISVMTALGALQSSIESGLSFLGSNIVQFSKYSPAFGSDDEKYKNRPNIDYAQARRFQRLMEPHTRVICHKLWARGLQAIANGKKTNPNIDLVGTNPYFIEANQFKIATGRMISETDVELARPVIVIGNVIAEKLYAPGDPLGQTIRLGDHNYTIIGVFAAKGSSFGGSEDGIAAIPITRLLSDRGRNERTINIAVQAPSQSEYEKTVGHGIGVLRIVRGLAVEKPNNFDIFSNDSLITSFKQVAATVKTGAFVISAVALLAAGVGIMNIMLVSVTERTREIGIRKSIGARRSSILAQFLIESLALSLAGGFFGVLLGVVAGNGIALLLKASAVFPWEWAIAGLLVCSGIGLVFGLYPARKAAALDPIEALRFE